MKKVAIFNFKRVLGFGGNIEKEKIQAEKAVITNQFSTFQLIVVDNRSTKADPGVQIEALINLPSVSSEE